MLSILLPFLAAAAGPESLPDARLADCVRQARADLATAVVTADEWLKGLKGTERAYPLECFGIIYTRQMQWEDAEQSLLEARDALLPQDRKRRARLGAMAGNAALADDRPGAGLASLDQAVSDAREAGEARAAGDIEVDRARALVALERFGEAEKALEAARRDSSGNADAWLLSATLARRLDKLKDAQFYIETAAALRPVDVEIGLEAGVIAVLAGRGDAARKSWQSVIKAAPDSAAAKVAQAYIEQLDKP